MGGDEGFALGGGETLGGGGDLGGLYAEVAGAEFGAVELGGVVADGFVAALANVGENSRDGVLDVFGNGRSLTKAGQFGIKGFGGKLKNAHGDRISRKGLPRPCYGRESENDFGPK